MEGAGAGSGGATRVAGRQTGSREDDLTAAVLDLEALRSPADAEVPQSLSALKRIISLNLHPDAGGRGTLTGCILRGVMAAPRGAEKARA